MSSVKVGSLVTSSNSFTGVGKIVSIDTHTQSAEIGFFASPLAPLANRLIVQAKDLIAVTALGDKTDLKLNTEVYVQFPGTNSWKMGYYQGVMPVEQTLVVFSKELKGTYDLTELYVPNAYPNKHFNVADFLKGQASSSPFLCNLLSKFYSDYYSQRRSCRSISALLSSSVELEKHQLAAVYEVLKDTDKKYLLCDEVGLGKTIEAGFIIRQHVLEKGRDSKVLVLVPDALIQQWQQELTERFHLGAVLNTDEDNDKPNVDILTFSQALTYEHEPTMVVVDEAHQISSHPFDGNLMEKELFSSISVLTNQSEITLLLTGTPMAGHRSAYLALLHLLNSEHFPLTDSSVELFNQLLPIQDRIRELSRIFVPENEDYLLYTSLNDLMDLEVEDETLDELVQVLQPHVNMFAMDKDPEQRQVLLQQLSEYLNNKYLFDYRMIRTSRATGIVEDEVSQIENLFPGLNPVQTIVWDAPKDEAYLDEHFEQYRSEMIASEEFNSLDLTQFKQIVESLLTSPISFSATVEKYLKKTNKSNLELSHWTHMLEQVESEQLTKNNALSEALSAWLLSRPEGKAVVFCGDRLTADNVYQFLTESINAVVERHQQGQTPAFNLDDNTRVLVCDERGEDGLNLQGKTRLAIHYSMPMAISRIEQRNGRLNRYSALSTGVNPIDTMILSTSRSTFYSKWVKSLIEGVGCFAHYRANIQDEIDTLLQQDIWPSVLQEGYLALEDAEEKLRDKTRSTYNHLDIIAKLATVDIDAEEAEKRLTQMREDDERFEESTALVDWIKHGMLFKSQRSESSDVYRFKYSSGSTRMRTSTLIDKCLLGLDIEASDYISPVTQELSLSRVKSVINGSYPLRYGQPFVDAIAEVSCHSTLANTSAIIRKIPIRQEPMLFFIPQWLVEGTANSTSEQIVLDSQYPPVVSLGVFGESGSLTPLNMATLVSAAYSTANGQVEIGGSQVPYQDTNITIQADESHTDVWSLIEPLVSKTRFINALDAVLEKSKADAIEQFEQQSEVGEVTPQAQLLTLKYVLLIGA
ncbi:protein DpdE [Vibrio vulnificus]|nr:DEAD/DEAH box helicase family protein [Vibrio vulnificus]MCU8460914.1 protein DpdE [Vibrio vulnificus]